MGPAGPGIDGGAAVTTDAPIGKPPVVTVAGGTLTAGFGAPVTLKATATDPETTDVSKLTFKWTQKGGAKATVTGDASDTLTFTTWTVAQAKANKDLHFGVLSISPDETGNYSFEVAVTDTDGNVTKATAAVKTTGVTAGLRNVPIGIKQFLMGEAGTQTTWNWSLDVTGAAGSAAALADATTRFPSFTPDVKGSYKLTESVSGQSLSIEAGKWLGMMGDEAACKACHNGTTAPDQFTPWSKTAHGRAIQAKLNGKTTAGADLVSFGRSCLECHTVGDSSLADNGGFDDVERTSTWKMPAKLQSGNWESLQKDNPALAKMAGIQCENCHGPQNSAAHAKSTDQGQRVSFSAGVCTSCHESGTHHYKGANWDSSRHAQRDLAVNDATFEARGTTAAHCGRCHTAQGFVAYSAQLLKGDSGNLKKPDGTAADEAYLRGLGLQKSTVEPITCAACHDPHDATNPGQLRLVDGIKSLPNGLTNITGVGTGATCMACHNTRNAEHDDFVTAPTSFSGPHTPAQTDMLFGFNAYFMPRLNPSKHLAVADTCAGCHVALPTAAQKAAGQTDNHAFTTNETICAECHSPSTNGEAFVAANAAQLADLGKAVDVKANATIAALYGGGDTLTVRVWDEATDYYSSASIPSVLLATAPTIASRAAIHGQTAFTLTLSAPVTVSWVDAKGAAAGSASLSVLNCRIGDITVTGKTLPVVPPAAAGLPLPAIAPDSVVAKAGWNYQLLSNDGTRGIHNPSFFQNVVVKTTEALAAP